MSDYENLMCHAAEIVSAIEKATPADECLLTKREAFAMHFMAAGITAQGERGSSNWDAHAEDAVNAADALLKRLADG